MSSDCTPEETILRDICVTSMRMDGAEFDRFIAKVKADALSEAAEATRAESLGDPHAGASFIAHARWLDERADRIEAGEA